MAFVIDQLDVGSFYDGDSHCDEAVSDRIAAIDQIFAAPKPTASIDTVRSLR